MNSKKKWKFYGLIWSLSLTLSLAMKDDYDLSDDEEKEELKKEFSKLNQQLELEKYNNEEKKSDKGSVGSVGSVVSVVSNEEIRQDADGKYIKSEEHSLITYSMDKTYLYTKGVFAENINDQLYIKICNNAEHFLTQREEKDITVGYFHLNVIFKKFEKPMDFKDVESKLKKAHKDIEEILAKVITSIIEKIEKNTIDILRKPSETFHFYFVLNFMYVYNKEEDMVFEGVTNKIKKDHLHNIWQENQENTSQCPPNIIYYQIPFLNNALSIRKEKKTYKFEPIKSYIPLINNLSLSHLLQHSRIAPSLMSVSTNKIKAIFPTDYLQAVIVGWIHVVGNENNWNKIITVKNIIYIQEESKHYNNMLNIYNNALDLYESLNIAETQKEKNPSVIYDNKTLTFKLDQIFIDYSNVKNNNYFITHLDIKAPNINAGKKTYLEPKANERRIVGSKKMILQINKM